MNDGDVDFLQRAIRRAERDRCAAIARKTAAYYHELAKAQSSDEARDIANHMSGVGISIANDIEGLA